MNAVIYARYSSHAQKDASIEQQLRVCRQYAYDHDMQVVGEYCDHALSGTSDKRPEFLRMIKDAAKGRWERVLVYKVDRFARNRYDSATYKAKLKKHGVKVMSAMEPIPDGPEGILLEAVLEGSAEYYSANLSQNIIRGMHDNALACKVNAGHLPLGYVKGPDGRYAIDEDKAAIVREIFEMYSGGMNAVEIANALNARGLRTSTGSVWNKNSLRSILKNERYIGVYQWRDVRVEGGVPAILEKELFERVQRQMAKIARAPAAARTDVDYMLTGKLFCGECGSPMVGESGIGKGGAKYCYYSCIKRKREKACNKKPVKKDWIEELVVMEMRKWCLNDAAIQAMVDAVLDLQARERDDSILRNLEAELAENKRAIANLIKAIEQGIITASTKERLDALEERRAVLEASITNEKAIPEGLTREQLTFWFERFRHGDPHDPGYRSDFIDAFVSAVYVYDDRLRICGNLEKDGKILEFDVVDGIVNGTVDSVEIFGFGACESTKEGVAEHVRLFVTQKHFVLLLPIDTMC